MNVNRANAGSVMSEMNDDSPNTRFKNVATINYETFESSSGGDEMSHGNFESEALSFHNKGKVVSSIERE